MKIRRQGPHPCMFCGQYAEFEVDDPTGEIAQNIWDWGHKKVRNLDSRLSPSQREILISGSHDQCFNDAFKEEE